MVFFITGSNFRLLVQPSPSLSQQPSSALRTLNPTSSALNQSSSAITRSTPAGAVLLNHSNESAIHRTRSNPTTIQSNNNISHQESNQPREDEQLQQLFPCRNPVNPHMRNIQSRLATYETGWPAERIQASSRELADSGLYYLGNYIIASFIKSGFKLNNS